MALGGHGTPVGRGRAYRHGCGLQNGAQLGVGVSRDLQSKSVRFCLGNGRCKDMPIGQHRYLLLLHDGAACYKGKDGWWLISSQRGQLDASEASHAVFCLPS